MNPLNEQSFKDRIDLNMREHMEANHWKERLEQAGFNYTISLYGVITNKTLDRHEYRRIEIFLNKPPEQYDVLGIKAFFDEFIPYPYFTIWAYNCDLKEIVYVEGWD